MTQCRTGDKPLHEPMIAKFNDVHMRQWGYELTHWGRVTHKCVSKIIIIGSDNGSSPGRLQAINWTNAGILLIGPLGINFSEILIEINIFPLKKMHLKMSSAKRRLFRLDLNELILIYRQTEYYQGTLAPKSTIQKLSQEKIILKMSSTYHYQGRMC